MVPKGLKQAANWLRQFYPEEMLIPWDWQDPEKWDNVGAMYVHSHSQAEQQTCLCFVEYCKQRYQCPVSATLVRLPTSWTRICDACLNTALRSGQNGCHPLDRSLPLLRHIHMLQVQFYSEKQSLHLLYLCSGLVTLPVRQALRRSEISISLYSSGYETIFFFRFQLITGGVKQ
jgi:hypothetical protein